MPRARSHLRLWAVLVATFGALMTCVSYVNGRIFDGELRAPAARTVGGALVLGLMQSALLFLFGLGLAMLGPIARRRSSRVEPGPFNLLGFADQAGYAAGRSVWELEGLTSIETAEIEADGWLSQQAPDACVEVIAFRRDQGHAVTLISQTGSELLD